MFIPLIRCSLSYCRLKKAPLSAGGENDLIIKKLNLLIGQGLSYEEVIKEITAYQAKTKLLFVLSKVDNLV